MQIKQICSKHLDSNTFIATENSQCLIIDCGAELEDVIKSVGKSKVVGILLTHGHYDHSINALEYARFFKTNIIASENIKTTVSDSIANYSEGSFCISDFSQFSLIAKDCQIDLGDFKIDCLLTEGHSPCCISYKIDKYLFAGDVLFENGIGRTDLIGSNKKAMLESLNKLESVKFETCFSGHGSSSDFQSQQKNIKVFKRFLSR